MTIQSPNREAAGTQRDDSDQVLQAVKFTKKVPGLHLDLDEDFQAAGCFTEIIRGYKMGVVEPDVMRGQPAGATNTSVQKRRAPEQHPQHGVEGRTPHRTEAFVAMRRSESLFVVVFVGPAPALVSALCIFLAHRFLYGTLWFVVSLCFALVLHCHTNP